MSTYKRKADFFETPEGKEVEQTLYLMVADTTYNTNASYSANTTVYPNNKIPFVAKHMDYLRNHPTTDPRHYISNLRLITRIKT